MTLYEIDTQLAALLDADTGEVLDYEQLEALSLEREAKIEGIALYIKSTEAEAAAIKSEEQALAERRRSKENKAARLRAYLADALAGQKMETARVRLSYRKSDGVQVDDEGAMLDYLMANHPECLKVQQPTANKTELSRLMKSGVEVPGAHIETRNNLQIK